MILCWDNARIATTSLITKIKIYLLEIQQYDDSYWSFWQLVVAEIG